ncbi:hypothetical protein B1NLA3E_20790 [Bacillus sp. 1NLA3E]|nr:hypothetical protein B1NLA3E_20790 [Bacillus sp. 1NLA3E]
MVIKTMLSWECKRNMTTSLTYKALLMITASIMTMLIMSIITVMAASAITKMTIVMCTIKIIDMMMLFIIPFIFPPISVTAPSDFFLIMFMRFKVFHFIQKIQEQI